VLAELIEEAEAVGDGGISDLTRQQVELSLAAAARKDDVFGQSVSELVARVREAEQAAGGSVTAGPGSTVFTRSAGVRAGSGGDRARPGSRERLHRPVAGPFPAGAGQPLTAPGVSPEIVTGVWRERGGGAAGFPPVLLPMLG
jgi:hypothetical protein